MGPGTIITALMVLGTLTLLIAPKIHRSINQKSRREVEARRAERVEALRTSATGFELKFDRNADAVQLRDALLLRGARVEVSEIGAQTVLAGHDADRELVETVAAELGLASN